MLKEAASAAVAAFVSQPLLGCAEGSGPEDGPPGCRLTAALIEGPFFVDEMLHRSDIRSDPVSGYVSPGVPLVLRFNVERLNGTACTPLTGAYIDVWHCDAGGVYSDVPSGAPGLRFLRGYQVTDANGVVQFTTVYPGWYTGRAVHVHFKLRLFAGTTRTYEFTSQFFFDEELTSTIHALSPYSNRGTRDRLNTEDAFYNTLSSAQQGALTLQPTADGSGGYSGAIALRVNVG
jgi:protocatechuate 3,4-dioxygenase beta subunit